MTTHVLKCATEFFNLSLARLKSFELRVNDRDYKPRDLLILLDYCPITKSFSGRAQLLRVLYVLSRESLLKISCGFALGENWVIMSLQPESLAELTEKERVDAQPYL